MLLFIIKYSKQLQNRSGSVVTVEIAAIQDVGGDGYEQ